MRSSQVAFDHIIKEEVSSKERYESHYRRPEWPGVSSGATVGFGYDLGQTDPATIRSDWAPYVSSPMLEAMVSASGYTGDRGRVKTAEIRNRVDIPWDVALTVHREKVIPRWEARLDRALPNTHELSGTCYGMLLSLGFNRGLSFSLDGDRYREMRNIKSHMASRNFRAIPGEFRSMKRLWPTVPGLQGRREREAVLFERGLSEGVAPQPSPGLPPALDKPIIRPGDPPSAGVNELKDRLTELLRLEHGYGPLCEALVRAFQKQRNLDVDGKVGQVQTWPALIKATEGD